MKIREKEYLVLLIYFIFKLNKKYIIIKPNKSMNQTNGTQLIQFYCI
jgi:hypothetical protein